MPTPIKSFLRKGWWIKVSVVARSRGGRLADLSHDRRGEEHVGNQGDHAELERVYVSGEFGMICSVGRTGATTEGGAKPYARKLPSSPAAINEKPSSHSLLRRNPLSVLGPELLLAGDTPRLRRAKSDSTGETRISGSPALDPTPAWVNPRSDGMVSSVGRVRTIKGVRSVERGREGDLRAPGRSSRCARFRCASLWVRAISTACRSQA